jgi:hypothetical protein
MCDEQKGRVVCSCSSLVTLRSSLNWSLPSPLGRGWPAIPMHFIGTRAGPSPAEGLLALKARSPLRPAGG